MAGENIQAVEGFVEDDDVRMIHQRTADEHLLLFALAEHAVFALGEMADLEQIENLVGAGDVVVVHLFPKAEGSKFAGEDDVQRIVVGWDELAEGGAHPTDALAQLDDGGMAKFKLQHLDMALRRKDVAIDHVQRGGFTAAIWAKDDPVFTAIHVPVDVFEDVFSVSDIGYVV